MKRDYSTSLGSIWAEFSVVERGDCRLFSIMVASENSDFAPLPYATQKNWFSPASTPRSSPHLHPCLSSDPDRAGSVCALSFSTPLIQGLTDHGSTVDSEMVEVNPWVPDWSTVGPRFLGGNRGSPHKNLQPWVPATSFLFCVRWATRPNCQPLTLSHLESDGGPTASMPSAARPHCILPARNLETLTIF